MKEHIVVDGITYYRKPVIDEVILNKAENYDWLVDDINWLLSEAQETYDYMKQEGFTTGMIEAEGFLRAMKIMADKIDDNTRD